MLCQGNTRPCEMGSEYYSVLFYILNVILHIRMLCLSNYITGFEAASPDLKRNFKRFAPGLSFNLGGKCLFCLVALSCFGR